MNSKLSFTYLVLLFFFFLDTSQLFAQNSKADSILSGINKYIAGGKADSALLDSILYEIASANLDTTSFKKLNDFADHLHGEDELTILFKTYFFRSLRDRALSAWAIDYGKKYISQLKKINTPLTHNAILILLADMRIPFRATNSVQEGFKYYSDRLKDYILKNDSNGISICYFVFGGFYRSIGLVDNSVYYLKKAASYLDTSETKSNTSVLWKNNSFLGRNGWLNYTEAIGGLNMDAGNYTESINYSHIALEYYYKGWNFSDLDLSFITTVLANAKLLLGQLDSVPYYLEIAEKIPENIAGLDQIAFTKEVRALYMIKINQLDSAVILLEALKKYCSNRYVPVNSTAGYITPDYYLAQISLEKEDFTSAINFLKNDIERAGLVRSVVLRDYRLLANTYQFAGFNNEALKASQTFINLQDSLLADERKYKNVSFEIEQQINSSESAINNLKNENRVASLTRNYSIGIAALLLLIAGIFFAQRNKIKEGKKRSDELLLNILPEEVAEELKYKGTADAKHFDEVTVMFTDFKNFTQISEKLSPTELVNEIHTCFKSFDDIIGKHNIEKIKTIGDAYMCAGGLPVANTTSATDVVNAAIEIQRFMLQHLQQRKNEGKEPFEIRIGIHTGPVVAGIVGAKKFAYDIWGDTVNIASRMESSGEAGKINISGATYELVKDKFKCEHRGKIEAKNKGEIEMYFVETIS